MPYGVVKKGSSYQVVKKDTGKVMGTHKTKEQALKQVKAIYANEGKK